MDGAGEKLLARAAGPFDQHGAVAFGDLRKHVEQLPHGLAVADDFVKAAFRREFLAQFVGQPEVAECLDAADRAAVGILERGRRDADGHPVATRVEDIDGLVNYRPTC